MAALLRNKRTTKNSINRMTQRPATTSLKGLRVTTELKILTNITEYFNEYFGNALKHYESFLLHEVYYYDNSIRVKKAFSTNHRQSLVQAFINHPFYYKCACDPELVSERPDTAIAYTLIKESGKTINLNDMLDSFQSIIEQDRTRADQSDSEVSARFAKAVAELEFLGYIRCPRGGKSDYILKLAI